jgi:hypothetical protein
MQRLDAVGDDFRTGRHSTQHPRLHQKLVGNVIGAHHRKAFLLEKADNGAEQGVIAARQLPPTLLAETPYPSGRA